MIFIVDNYDSFTYNLVQAVGKFDPDVVVARNDRFDPKSVVARRPTAILISPGPGRPEDAGRTIAMIAAAERQAIPLLGVCLGHQAIAVTTTAASSSARRAPRHGKSSRVTHHGAGLFAGLPNPFEAARYHSLVVREAGLPAELTVTARSDDGVVMALSHRSLPVFGVQFHPESVLTPDGEKLLANFLGRGAADDADRSPRPCKIVAARKPLPRDLAERTFLDLMDGKATEAQKGALLLGIATRGETAEEIAGAVAALRRADAPRPDAALAAAGHLRAGRHRPRPLQHLDRGRGRGGGRRRLRRQARQPFHLLPGRVGRRPLRLRRRDRPRPADGGPRAGRGRARVPVRAVLPPGDEGARDRAPGARRADDLQRARAPREPGRRDAAADRRRTAGARRLLADALASSGPSGLSSSTPSNGLDELVPGVPASGVEVNDGWTRPWKFDPAALPQTTVALEELAGGDAQGNAAMLESLLDGEAGPRREAVASERRAWR